VLAIIANVLLILAPAAAEPLSEQMREKLIYQASRIIQQRAYVTGVDFAAWPAHLDAHREALNQAADERAFVAEFNKALAAFGVSHISLVPPRAAERRRTNEQVGIGVSLVPHDDGLRITRVFAGSPAAEAKLDADEIITAINGNSPPDRAELAGDEGSKVALTLRDVQGTTRDVELTRRKFSVRRPETLTPLADDAAVLILPTFATGYSRETIESLFRAAAPLRFLIVDVRGNGGGETKNLSHFLGCLLPKDTAIGVSVSRMLANRHAERTGEQTADAVRIAAASDRKWTIREAPVEMFKGEIGVLIDSGSGSAAEIAAAALRDFRDATLAGTPTAGKVLVSAYISITDGWEIKVPMSDYVTAKGVRLEGTPIEPSLRLPSPRRNAEDTAAATLLAELRRVVASRAEKTTMPTTNIEPAGQAEESGSPK
jgi:carboxyl-terminal processing protease